MFKVSADQLIGRQLCHFTALFGTPLRPQRRLFTRLRSLAQAMDRNGLSNGPSAPSSAPKSKKKLRILCLHGYLQDAEVSPVDANACSINMPSWQAKARAHIASSQVFSGRIGSMRKALKSRAEFIFVDAPHEAKGEEADIRAAGGTGDHPRTWWQWEVICGPSLKPNCPHV